MLTLSHWITVAVTAVAVIACVTLHYECLRFMTGTEAIAGLTFITWSASYTFMEMLKIWGNDE